MKQSVPDRQPHSRAIWCAAAGLAMLLPVGVLAQDGSRQSQDKQTVQAKDLAAKAQDEAQKPTLPDYTDGEAQIVEGFNNPDDWIQGDLWVETEFDSDKDGKLDRMHVDFTRQKQTETEGLKVPVIYATSPYYSGTSGTAKEFFWNPEQEIGAVPPVRKNPPGIETRERRPIISQSEIATWVPRGFAVVHSESPGTGLSQGCPTVGGDNESLAPKAVIDWLNGRAKGYTTPDGDEEVKSDWCTGKVGMTGTSYNGTLPLAAATTGVDGLEAIIPIAPNTSYYHYYRSNGLVRHPGGYMGEDIDVLYDYINSGNPDRRDDCNSMIRDQEMAEGFDRQHGDYNDFWAGRDYLNELGPLKCAVLMSHGFNDWNVVPEHSVRIYEALKAKGVPTMCYYHQGGHGGPPPLKLMNRWFTRYVCGIENGVENDPRAWIVRADLPEEPMPADDAGTGNGTSNGDGNNNANANANQGNNQDNNQGGAGNAGGNQDNAARGGRRGGRGRGGRGRGGRRGMPEPTSYADYPNPEARPVELHLTPGGRTSGGLGTSHDGSTGQEMLVDDASLTGTALAQEEESEHRLLYVTPELTKAVHISGTPKLTIRLACNKPAANLSVWLVALPWEGGRITDDIITRGWADPQNWRSLRESEPLEPGKFYEMTFNLQPDDQVIQPGQKIALMIMSSDHDFTLWPPSGTELTVDLGATSLELPVVGGESAWADALAPKAEGKN